MAFLGGASWAGADEAIDLGSLLGSMLDRGSIAEFPRPEFICKQASSHTLPIRRTVAGGTERLAPVGEFFGGGPGLNPFKDWWRMVGKDGWMTCRWPMPF